MLVQLNKCVVVCGSDLQRGHSGDGCFTLLIWFKYEHSRGSRSDSVRNYPDSSMCIYVLLYALFNHPHLLIQVAWVQKAQFPYRLD